jgi:hypothetical protein
LIEGYPVVAGIVRIVKNDEPLGLDGVVADSAVAGRYQNGLGVPGRKDVDDVAAPLARPFGVNEALRIIRLVLALGVRFTGATSPIDAEIAHTPVLEGSDLGKVGRRRKIRLIGQRREPRITLAAVVPLRIQVNTYPAITEPRPAVRVPRARAVFLTRASSASPPLGFLDHSHLHRRAAHAPRKKISSPLLQ